MAEQNKVQKSNSLIRQLRDFGIGPIVGLGISMFTVPITTKLLSPEEFGKSSLFTLFQSLFLIVGLLGLDQGYVRYYNDKETDRTELFQNALFFPLIFCPLLITICLLFLKPISTFLFGSVEIGLMIAFCVFIPILLLNRFFLLQIRMDLKGKTYSLLNVISQIISFVILLFLLYFYQRTFRSIVYATIFAMCINTFLCFLFCDKSFIKKKFVYAKELQVQLMKFSLPLVPATLLSWLLNSFDKVGLRTWSNFEQLGLYAAAFKIVALVNVFQNIFSTTWIPIAYKWHEDNVPNKKFEEISTIVLSGMVMLFSMILVFRDIIMLFLGADYRGTAHVFVFLLFVPVMYTVSETTSLGIGFAKKTMYSLYIAAIAVVLNLLGNYLLIPKYGAEGAAITTCVSYIVFFWGRTLFSRKVWFKFKLGKYFINILLLLSFGVNMIVWKSKIIEICIFAIVIIFNGIFVYKIFRDRKIKKNCNKRGNMISFNVPPHSGNEEKYIAEAISNKKICGDGPFTKKCNEWFEKKFNAKKVLLTTSGTSALEMAALLCDVKPGDEVIMPSYTFCSTADAFVQRGCKIVFVDVRPDTMNIDEKLIEQAITEKTKVICVVHYAGVACEMDTIMDIAHRHNLKVVEDAAQAVMSSYKGKALGTIGDYGCYSFHETKNYSMGEGGAIVINTNIEDIEKAEIIREKGTNRSKFWRGQIDKYTWVDYGSSYLPSELNAAYLWAQLEVADKIINSRLSVWNRYNEAFKSLADSGKIELPVIPEGCVHNAHMFYIKCRDLEERTKFISFMKEHGIGCVFHYIPLHSAPAGVKFGRFDGEDKFTTKESDRLVRLPLWYGMKDTDVENVISTTKKFYNL